MAGRPRRQAGLAQEAQEAQALLESGVCGDEGEGLYHVTLATSWPSIQRGGLVPNAGKQFNFKPYRSHSLGKVFLAGGLEAAHLWAEKLWNRTGFRPIVRLRVVGPTPPIRIDHRGQKSGIDCSFYLTDYIPTGSLLLDKVYASSEFEIL